MRSISFVEDDGVGPVDVGSGGRGLENMAARARKLGGSCVFDGRKPSGSRLRWSVPTT
jgi:signal transduction histidine kinase